MKVLHGFPIMIELMVLVNEPDGDLSTAYVVRNSNGQPASFCVTDDELAAYISALRDDVVEGVKHSDSQK